VKAETAGNVWEIRIEAGAAVDAGEEILILESMKMEIPIEAPRAGVVVGVRLQKGDAVKEGDVLFLLEPR
jgi:biotin carboxyl carrier protein